MPEISYTEQSAGAVRLFLTEGDFNYGQFTVLKRDTFPWNEYTVTFGILAESHFVEIKHDGMRTFNEICACTDAQLPEHNTIHCADFLPNLHSVPIIVTSDIRTYSFTFSYLHWEEGNAILNDLRAKVGTEHVHLLIHEFPIEEASHEIPVTEVYIEATPRELRIHSIHTYPNEHIVVHTTSTFET